MHRVEPTFQNPPCGLDWGEWDAMTCNDPNKPHRTYAATRETHWFRTDSNRQSLVNLTDMFGIFAWVCVRDSYMTWITSPAICCKHLAQWPSALRNVANPCCANDFHAQMDVVVDCHSFTLRYNLDPRTVVGIAEMLRQPYRDRLRVVVASVLPRKQRWVDRRWVMWLIFFCGSILR